MSTTKVFLSLDVDADGIPQEQVAIDAIDMAVEVCAAPAGVSYITCGTGDNVGVAALPISDFAAANLDLTGKTLTVTDLVVKSSDFVVNSCPIPLPFAYAKLSDDGTAAATETNVGAGATIVEIESNSDDIIWDGSNDYFTVVKAGTYELTARVVLEVASTTVVTLKIKTGATIHNTFSPKINSAVDPQEATIHAVFTASADDDISVTHTDDAATNVNAGAGTTLVLKRLK